MRKFEEYRSAASEIWRAGSFEQGLEADVHTLRARAERYRRLAETLYDMRTRAVVLACARDLEAQATRLGDDH